MEIKWLHDRNLRETKQKLEFAKHVWGKIESLTQCLGLQLSALFTKIVLYLYIYINIV